MRVLGIESSCDETGVGIVDEAGTIHAHALLSQIDMHKIHGGVVPEIAARAHLDHLDGLIRHAVDEAGMTLSEIDAFAATCGPGLIGGVMVGAIAAKSLAAMFDKPFIAINHLAAHALTPRMTDMVEFPYLLLLVSGGHTQLLIVEGVDKFKRLGTTLDDAGGEAFDKAAKLLNLGYPGGPAVERAAAGCTDHAAALEKFPLKPPMQGRDNCDFSFSGLKSAIRRYAMEMQEAGDMNDASVQALCYAFQNAFGKTVTDRTNRAIEQFRGLYNFDEIRAKNPAWQPTLVVSGGVAANQFLRGALVELADRNGMKFIAPPLKFCADNGVMIAWAGVEHIRAGATGDPLDFKVRPRWPLDPDAEPKIGAGVKA